MRKCGDQFIGFPHFRDFGGIGLTLKEFILKVGDMASLSLNIEN
jgi:hypothetical protein